MITIDITGMTPHRRGRREIPSKGELYSTFKINEGRARLNRLGFFEEVKISGPQGQSENTLDMKVDVTERPTGSFSVGAGFSNLETSSLPPMFRRTTSSLGYTMSAAANVSGVSRATSDF